MKLTLSFAVLLTLFSFMPASSQQVSVELKDATLREVFRTLKQQTGVVFVYTEQEVDHTSRVNAVIHDMPLDKAMQTILLSLPYSYEWVNDMIIIRSDREKAVGRQQQPQTVTVVSGLVKDQQGQPLAGVTVVVKNGTVGAATGKDGRFTLRIPATAQHLVCTCIGMKAKEVAISGKTEFNIVMEEDTEKITETVVTGIFQRNKESFTGSSSRFTGQELKIVGNQNILQSLKTLDPSFAIIENNEFGSDPNRLPNIEIRGKSSVIGLAGEYGTDPNQPLFILDGFESTLATISDLSMDRVESITLLKDAAATAIYGSKAANGVVVVETKRPAAGSLNVTYNLNLSFSFADLSDYNLMNSAEKLEFEKWSGYFGSIYPNGDFQSEDADVNYLNRLRDISRGVDSYWMNEPLRFATTHRHNLFVEGGDESMRYGVTLSYGDAQGVMKFSDRQTVSGNVRLLYRRGNLSFNNSLTVNYVDARRETIPFSKFARANPYHRKYNAQGGIDKVLDSFTYLDIATFTTKTEYFYNPVYDMLNNNMNRTETTNITNNFEIEWRILDALRARGRMGIGKTVENYRRFRSPDNSEFALMEFMYRGVYNESNTNQFNYDGDLNLTYGKLFNDVHMVNAVAGFTFNQFDSRESAYDVVGFVDDDFTNPAFGFGYPDNSKSQYYESRRRAASFYLNTGYTYDSRYLFDVNFRTDGSSVYGANKHFANTWSVGLGWNIHKEAFFGSGRAINLLKLRASVGNPGNQNFDDYISSRIYTYNYDVSNPFGTSLIVSNIGNANLQWQKTLDRNVGIDLIFLNNRMKLNFDYFNKKTDPLLVYIAMPSSVGTTSIPQNFGSQITKGFTAVLNYAIIRRDDLMWSFNANGRSLKSEYRDVERALSKYNKENQSRDMTRYYDGGSPSDLWAVRSVGIDPMTGREIFLNKNGRQTFLHSYDNEVVVGNSDPDVEGIIGTSFYYKGFSLAINMQYKLGGQIFLQTLYNKVENITTTTVQFNQDKRALYDRWKKPGDTAKFKAISMSTSTPMSSRFVANNNVLTGESISAGYEGSPKWLEPAGISAVTFRLYMNDIFRISTVKNERGLEYPFARSISMSLGLRF